MFILFAPAHTLRKRTSLSEKMFLKSITVTGFSLADLMSQKRQDLSLNFTSYLTVFTAQVKVELTMRGRKCKIKHQGGEKIEITSVMEMKMHDLR